MHTEPEHSRTRPRVSRACERCRIKKAKCDGSKPCKRCDLDKAPCTYRIRRKTESANATQRYTDLLLQHHAALTAGLIELYSRLRKGEKWEGSPVEEINGSPSVHCILEQLGVIESEDDPETKPDQPTRHGSVSSNHSPPSIGPAPKMRKLSRALPVKESEAHELESSSHSPVSTASTCTLIAPAPSMFNTGESEAAKYATQMVSSPNLVSTSGLSTSSNNTGTPWDSPEFAEDLFTTPVPTPKPSSASLEYQLQAQRQACYPKAPMNNMSQVQDLNQDMYARDQMPNGLVMPYTSPDNEACGAGYFYDATGGMNMYNWDGNVGNAMGYTGFGQDFGAWDSGVFV